MQAVPNRARLSVNLNKVALLRNSRGGNLPDVLRVATDCVRYGAQGITVHPRPDERHTRKADVRALRPLCQQLGVELNVEGYPSPDFLALVAETRPEQVTLVPDGPGVLTSHEGWHPDQVALLTPIVAQLHALGLRVSLFVEANSADITALAQTGTDRVELYTGPYAEVFAARGPEAALPPYVAAAETAAALGLGLNAGHDLNQYNLRPFAAALPMLLEVSIGHALIADALYEGLENTIAGYLSCLGAG